MIGIDIGGTRTKMGLVDLRAGQLLETQVCATQTTDAGRFEQTITDTVRAFGETARAHGVSIRGIGIGVSAYVDADGRVDSTYGFMPFLDQYPLAQRMEQLTGLPCRVDNDARLVALGEAVFGKGRGYERVLVLTLGTGVGVGFVVKGQLDGPLPHGHMSGHLTVTQNDVRCYCGKTGCLESLVSATALTQAADRLNWAEKYPPLPLTAVAIFRAGETGNADARALVGQVVAHLKIGIDNYINLFAPDIIVLGGGMANGLTTYLPHLHSPNQLRPTTTYRVVIDTSALGEQAGILGGAFLFSDENN